MHPPRLTPLWATAVMAPAPGDFGAQQLALGAHLRLCSGHAGAWLGLRCGAQALHGFIATRLVSCALALLAAGVAWAWLA